MQCQVMLNFWTSEQIFINMKRQMYALLVMHIKMALEGAHNIFIHSDDTDVFVLAVHWVHTLKIKANVIIRRLSNNNNVCINKVTEELGPLASNLLPLCILTGNDHLLFPLIKERLLH